MPIQLNEPPQDGASSIDWRRWSVTLWRYVRPNCETQGQGNASMGTGISCLFVTTASAPQTKTLPPTSSLADGEKVRVEDRSGNAAAQNITIAAAAGDTLVGGTSIVANYGIWEGTKKGTQWLGRVM